MKKVALSLLAFAMAGALAFGQSAPAAKISGYVNSGIIVANSDSNTYTQLYANDYGASGAAVKLAVDLTAENFGYHLALNHKQSETGTAGLDGAWAWVSPMEGFTIEASSAGNNAPFGDLDDKGVGAYSTTGINAWYTTGGLSIGAELAPAGSSPFISTAFPVFIGARYAVDKVVTVNAYGTNGLTNSLDAIHVTAAVSAVPNLTLTAGYNATSLSVSDATNSFVDVALGYQITEAFYVGVVGYANNLNAIAAQNGGNASSYFSYKPNLSYMISPEVKLSAYLIGDTSESQNFEPQAQLTFTPVPGATIKASVWMDTNSAGVAYNQNQGPNAALMSPAISSSNVVAADLDLIFSF